jgi:hypothetical protein
VASLYSTGSLDGVNMFIVVAACSMVWCWCSTSYSTNPSMSGTQNWPDLLVVRIQVAGRSQWLYS